MTVSADTSPPRRRGRKPTLDGRWKHKSCIYEGCTKHPSYGENGSETPAFCAQHAPKGMVNVRIRRCTHPDCQTLASYGPASTRFPKFCARHALDGMVNVRKRRCQHESCVKLAACGVEGSGRVDYCARHAPEGMISMGRKRCAHSGCSTRCVFGDPGTTTPIYCSKHATIGMVDVVNRRCAFLGCLKTASLGKKGRGRKAWCPRHATEEMVNLRKICIESGCSCLAAHGVEGVPGSHCAQHAREGMVNVYRKACTMEGCTKHSSHGMPGGESSTCAEHATKGMVLVELGDEIPTPDTCTISAMSSTTATGDAELCTEQATMATVGVSETACKREDDAVYSSERVRESDTTEGVALSGEERSGGVAKQLSAEECSTKQPTCGVARVGKPGLCIKREGGHTDNLASGRGYGISCSSSSGYSVLGIQITSFHPHHSKEPTFAVERKAVPHEGWPSVPYYDFKGSNEAGSYVERTGTGMVNVKAPWDDSVSCSTQAPRGVGSETTEKFCTVSTMSEKMHVEGTSTDYGVGCAIPPARGFVGSGHEEVSPRIALGMIDVPGRLYSDGSNERRPMHRATSSEEEQRDNQHYTEHRPILLRAANKHRSDGATYSKDGAEVMDFSGRKSREFFSTSREYIVLDEDGVTATGSGRWSTVSVTSGLKRSDRCGHDNGVVTKRPRQNLNHGSNSEVADETINRIPERLSRVKMEVILSP